MKAKIEILVRRLGIAAMNNPVEVFLAVLFCFFGCLLYETVDKGLETIIFYFPVSFLTTYILNSLSEGKRWRFVYYLSVLLFIPFYWVEESYSSTFYWVTLVVIQLLYLICDWRRDNELFFRKGLGYLRAMLSSGLLAGVAFLLSLSIYFSIRYIFEIWQGGEGRFVAYSLSVAFAGVMPLLFLLFNQTEEEDAPNLLFNVLLNYVLSPALLIYAVILYLYFVKIAVLWSLPKGAVAYIAAGFVSATFLLKGCQIFLERRSYDWFFRYSCWAVLPALLMYWVGAFYRINQYGYTEARVYLVAVGVVLTGMALLFFTKRTGRYLYVAILTIFCLSAITYIPGITAKHIERISQEKRGGYTPKYDGGGYYEYITITDHTPLDVTGFETLQTVGRDREGEINHVVDYEMFYLRDKDQQIIMGGSKEDILIRQMKKMGLAPTDSIPEEAYSEILQLDLDSAVYVFKEITAYRESPDSTYSVSYMEDGYYLKKRLPLNR